jgi:hypothetical protein
MDRDPGTAQGQDGLWIEKGPYALVSKPLTLTEGGGFPSRSCMDRAVLGNPTPPTVVRRGALPLPNGSGGSARDRGYYCTRPPLFRLLANLQHRYDATATAQLS